MQTLIPAGSVFVPMKPGADSQIARAPELIRGSSSIPRSLSIPPFYLGRQIQG